MGQFDNVNLKGGLSAINMAGDPEFIPVDVGLGRLVAAGYEARISVTTMKLNYKKQGFDGSLSISKDELVDGRAVARAEKRA